MHSSPTPGRVRLLAPIALAAFAIAFFVVILTSAGDDGGGGDTASTTARTTTARGAARRQGQTAQGSTYTVKTGDTLGGIAESTGVPVERLQELNPELDPQALVSGQRIKLRE